MADGYYGVRDLHAGAVTERMSQEKPVAILSEDTQVDLAATGDAPSRIHEDS